MGVTIGITCFNAQDTINRCITSAIQAVGEGDEILIVDDNSNDVSVEIIMEIIDSVAIRIDSSEKTSKNVFKFPNGLQIRLIRHHINRGVAAARNTLVENAKGTFIAFLDDDDVCKPDRIRLQTKKLLEVEQFVSNNRVLCFGDREVKNGNKKIFRIEGIGRKGMPLGGSCCIDYVLFGKKEADFSYGRYGACTLFARTNLLKELAGFDESFRRCEESVLVVKHCLNGGVVTSVDLPIITQNITEGFLNEKGYSAEKKYYKMLVSHYRYYFQENYTRRKYYYSKYRHLRRISNHFDRRAAYIYYSAMCCILEPSLIMKKLNA